MGKSVIFMCVFLVFFGNVCSTPTTTATPGYQRTSQNQSHHVAEIQNLLISSHINDHFKKTLITLHLKNQDNNRKEIKLSFLLPEKDSYVDKLYLQNVWHDPRQESNSYKITRNDMTALTKQAYRVLVAQEVSVALLEKDPDDPERYNLLVNLPARSECLVEVSAAEILPVTQDYEYYILTRFQTDHEIQNLHYIVEIVDSRPIQSITVSGPKTEVTKNADTLKNAVVREIGQHTAVINFAPDQDQIRQIVMGSEQKEDPSANGVDFVVHYKIDTSVNVGYKLARPSSMQNHQFHLTRGPIRPLNVSGIRPSELEKLKAVKELVESSRSGQVDSHLIERLNNLELVTSVTSVLAGEKAERMYLSRNDFIRLG